MGTNSNYKVNEIVDIVVVVLVVDSDAGPFFGSVRARRAEGQGRYSYFAIMPQKRVIYFI